MNSRNVVHSLVNTSYNVCRSIISAIHRKSLNNLSQLVEITDSSECDCCVINQPLSSTLKINYNFGDIITRVNINKMTSGVCRKIRPWA